MIQFANLDILYFCLSNFWKMFLVIFGRPGPQNINSHIRNINCASTKNSGSPFMGFKLQFWIFIFLSYFMNLGYPDLRRSDQMRPVKPTFRIILSVLEYLEKRRYQRYIYIYIYIFGFLGLSGSSLLQIFMVFTWLHIVLMRFYMVFT